MAKKRNLFIMLCVALALILAYVIFAVFANTGNNSAENIVVFSGGNSVEKISAEANGGYTLVKVGDTWQLEGDSEFPLNSGAVQTMLNAISPLYATAKVSENLMAAEEYGFDEPFNTVTITAQAANGNVETVLVFGDINAYTTDTYMTVSGHSDMYTVKADTVIAFDKDVLSLIEPEVWPVTGTAQISAVQFNFASGDDYTVKIERESSAQSGGETNSTTTDEVQSGTEPVKYLVTTQSEQFYAESDPASILIHSLVSIYYTECAHYNASDSELETYGLLAPFFTLDITATDYDGADISQSLQVGGIAEDGTYYVKQAHSNTVYKMDAMILQEIIDTSADSLLG